MATQGEDLRLAAGSQMTVLVTAEASSERLECARFIHRNGLRRDGPFITVGCSADERPAGAGATLDLRLLFDRARGGTLFIDDIAKLSAQDQTELLTILDDRGPGRDDACDERRRPDVRVIAGGDHVLGAEIAAGRFSERLFYRLNLIHVLVHNDRAQPGHLEGGSAMKNTKVRDLMSAPAQTCQPDTDLAAVTKLMWDHDCGFVPVIDASGGVAGVITDRDISVATATRRQPPERISAAQTMTSHVHVSMQDDTLSEALATMKRFKVRRLPVVDSSGRLQGVISMNDVVLASHETQDPPASEVVSTLASICAHRTLKTAVA
jgi:CBS domain-containing protein